MIKIAILNETNPAHLEEVKKEMAVLGAPRIRAVWVECMDHYAAMEGSHRIVAAKELGIDPIIEPIEYTDGPCPDDQCWDLSVSQICDQSHDSIEIEFESVEFD